MAAVVAAIVPVFLVILLGLVLRHTLLREDAHWQGLERATYYVLFPALLIGTLATADLGRVAALPAGLALLAGVLTIAGLLVAGRRPLSAWLGLDGPAFTSAFQGSCRWNTAVALSIAGALYGDVGVTIAAVAGIAIIPVLNVLSVVVLARYGAAKAAPNWTEVLRLLATNPFILGTAAGIAVNLGGLALPAVVLSFADILGRAALGIGLLAVGAGLRVGGLARPRPATWAVTAIRLLAMPAVVMAVAIALGVGGPSLAAAVICAAVPSASSGYILARQMGGDAPLLAEILTLQTIAAMATLPLLITLAELLG